MFIRSLLDPKFIQKQNPRKYTSEILEQTTVTAQNICISLDFQLMYKLSHKRRMHVGLCMPPITKTMHRIIEVTASHTVTCKPSTYCEHIARDTHETDGSKNMTQFSITIAQVKKWAMMAAAMWSVTGTQRTLNFEMFVAKNLFDFCLSELGAI